MQERIVSGMHLLAGRVYLDILQDPLKIIDEGKLLTDNTVIKDTGSSAYQLLMAIGIIGVVCSLVLAGIRLSFARNSRSRSEVKKSIGATLLIAIVMFGFVGLLGLILEVVNSL